MPADLSPLLVSSTELRRFRQCLDWTRETVAPHPSSPSQVPTTPPDGRLCGREMDREAARLRRRMGMDRRDGAGRQEGRKDAIRSLEATPCRPLAQTPPHYHPTAAFELLVASHTSRLTLSREIPLPIRSGVCLASGFFVWLDSVALGLFLLHQTLSLHCHRFSRRAGFGMGKSRSPRPTRTRLAVFPPLIRASSPSRLLGHARLSRSHAMPHPRVSAVLFDMVSPYPCALQTRRRIDVDALHSL